jgi:hypothetical protein
VFVVAQGDAFRLVTGNRRDSQAELASFAPLRDFLQRGYRRELQIGDFTLYLRRPGADARDPSARSGA